MRRSLPVLMSMLACASLDGEANDVRIAEYFPLVPGTVWEYAASDVSFATEEGKRVEFGKERSRITTRILPGADGALDTVTLATERIQTDLQTLETSIYRERLVLSSSDREIWILSLSQESLSEDDDLSSSFSTSYNPPQIFVRLPALDAGGYVSTREVNGGVFSVWPIEESRTTITDPDGVEREAVRVSYKGKGDLNAIELLAESVVISSSIRFDETVVYALGIGPVERTGTIYFDMMDKRERQLEIEIVINETLVRFQPAKR